MLKGISGNKHTSHFVLYDEGSRVRLLHSIIDRLPTDVQRQFTIGEYTVEYGYTYHEYRLSCIRRSASGENTDSMGGAVFGELCGELCGVTVWGSWEELCVGDSGGGAVCGELCRGSCTGSCVG